MVGTARFELATYGTQNRRATKLRHAPNPFVLSMKGSFDKSDNSYPCLLYTSDAADE